MSILAFIAKFLGVAASEEEDEPKPKHKATKVDRDGNVVKPVRKVILRANNPNPKKKSRR
jgi:hypothetical protein